jgi:hypothetical protein
MRTIYVFSFLLIIFIGYSSEKEQPNILFIMSDDHCERAIGVYGSRLAKLNPTPTLDKLANEGMVFNPKNSSPDEVIWV